MTTVEPRALSAIVETTSCPLCGCEDVSVIHDGCLDRRHGLIGEFGVVECRCCGLVRTSPRPTRQAMQAFYPPSYVPYAPTPPASGSTVYRALRAVARVPYRLRFGSEPAAPPAPFSGAAALDVGCGTGAELRRLRDRGWDVYGIEPDAACVELARAELGLDAQRVVAAAVEDAAFPPETFHLVVLTHVLEHLHDPVRVLNAIHGWAAEGAELRIAVPNLAGREARMFGRHWFGLDLPRHLFHFTPRTLHAVLDAAGFEVTDMRPDLGASSLEGSVSHVLADRRRKRTYVPSRRLYLAAVPVASLLSFVGWAPAITVFARKRSR